MAPPAETFGLADPAQWRALMRAIAPDGVDSVLNRILRQMRDEGATLAVLEYEYVDADFRDEFVSYYATTFRQPKSSTQRLHFFKSVEGVDRYLGFCVLRPFTHHRVGRTLIQPPETLKRFVTCVTTEVVRPLDLRLSVSGFPFMQQDSQLGVCAHASIWMSAHYHHLANRTPRRFLSEIATFAAGHPEIFRVSPSDGISEKQVGFALNQMGLRPVPYEIAELEPGQSVSQTVCRYLNSRMPVILATQSHANVLIGYGRDVRGEIFYVRADEGTAPYEAFYPKDDPLGQWRFLFAPLPGKIYLTGEQAETHARTLFDGLRRRVPAEVRPRLADIRFRTYVTQFGDYKLNMRERLMPDPIRELFRDQGGSRWVWVTEFQDRSLAETDAICVLGEVVMDATSAGADPNRLFACLPGLVYLWDDDGLLAIDAEDYEPYISGSAVHDAPVADVLGTPRPSRAAKFARRAKHIVQG